MAGLVCQHLIEGLVEDRSGVAHVVTDDSTQTSGLKARAPLAQGNALGSDLRDTWKRFPIR
jgi:hypothetical protein